MWQRAIDTVLKGIPGVQVYLDDILVTGSSETEHLHNLDLVLTRLNEFGLKANSRKCEWFQSSVTYLGHKIDKEGLHTSNDKIDDILNAPPPKDVAQLSSFLGHVNYYARFLSTVLAPDIMTPICLLSWTVMPLVTALEPLFRILSWMAVKSLWHVHQGRLLAVRGITHK